MKVATELAGPVIEETKPKDFRGEIPWTPSRPLRPDEEYVSNCLISGGDLVSVCDQMAMATEFLTGYRDRFRKTRMLITRFDYIVYHIENHLIRSMSVLDRSLLLTNVVFRLGIPEQECRFKVVAHNEHVVRTRVAKSLRSLDALLNPLRSQRNIVIHRRGHSDSTLRRLEPYYILQKVERKTPECDDPTVRLRFMFKSLTDQLVSKRKQELAAVNENVFSEVGRFLVALEPVFLRTCAALQNTG